MPELVNQPFQVLKWWPQVLVACQCKKEEGILTLITLTGLQSRVVCENCNVTYYVDRFIQGPQGIAPVILSERPSGLVM